MKKFSGGLDGGLSGGYVGTNSNELAFTTTVFIFVIGVLVVMASLMWGGQIHFASSQDLNVTASVLSATAVILIFYILYSLTVAANACVLTQNSL